MKKLGARSLARRALVVLVLVVGTTGASHAPSTAQTAEAAGPVVITVEPGAFDPVASHWTLGAPRYEDSPVIGTLGATHLHAFGAGQGRLVYRVRLTTAPGQETFVIARLSSEHPWYSAPPDWVSDVKLVVNGQAYGTRRVIADNGSGERYRWRVPAAAWRAGRNSIAFVVPLDSPYQNGLCIYGPAVVAGQQDARIVVRLAG